MCIHSWPENVFKKIMLWHSIERKSYWEHRQMLVSGLAIWLKTTELAKSSRSRFRITKTKRINYGKPHHCHATLLITKSNSVGSLFQYGETEVANLGKKKVHRYMVLAGFNSMFVFNLMFLLSSQSCYLANGTLSNW